MLKGNFAHISSFNQILFSLSLVVGSTFILLFLGALLSYLFFDINILVDTAALDINADKANIAALKFYQAIYSIGMFVIPPFIIAYLLSSHVRKYLEIDRLAKTSSFIIASFLVLFSLPFINMLGELNSQIHFPEFLKGVEEWMRNSEEHAALITQKFLKMDGLADLITNLVLVAVIPALGEELLFRGVLQKQLTKLTGSVHWGIFIAAFCFSALHVQFFGFFPRLFMGMMFGYLLVWTGSLWIPIGAHLLNNGLAVTASYMTNMGQLSEYAENIGSSEMMWGSSILSLLLILILMYWLFKTRKRQVKC